MIENGHEEHSRGRKVAGLPRPASENRGCIAGQRKTSSPKQGMEVENSRVRTLLSHVNGVTETTACNIEDGTDDNTPSRVSYFLIE
jgi:hypothetical protein